MKKQLFSIILIFVLLVFIHPPQVAFSQVLTYELDGFTVDFDKASGTILKAYDIKKINIVIPDEIDGVAVKKIGAEAFYSNLGLVSLGFLESSQLQEIGDYAFLSCYNLTSVTIPSSVQKIGEGAFYDCENLASVSFLGKSQLKTIGDYAFYWCFVLKSITIPSSVEEIGLGAFFSCKYLESVKFLENSQLKTIGNNAFGYCGFLKNIEIPSKVELIDNFAFRDCERLESVKFLENSQLKIIGTDAFLNCAALKSITIPSKVEKISGGAFANCSSLKNVEFLNCNVLIGSVAFSDTPWFLNLKIKTKNPDFLFAQDNRIVFLTGLSDNITIPDGVVSVTMSDEFFSQETLRYKIKIPKSVSAINSNINLFGRKFVVDELNPYYSSDNDGSLYDKDKTKLIAVPVNQNEINIPNTVKTIGREAFYENKNLETVVLPDSVEIIEDYAFYEAKVKNIKLSNNLKSIGAYAFFVGDFDSISLPDSLEEIGESAFAICNNLRSVTIGENVKVIKEGAFSGCDSLEEVIIKSNLTRLEEYAFYLCYNLKKLTFTKDAPEFIDFYGFLYTHDDFTFYYYDGAKGFESKIWGLFKTVKLSHVEISTERFNDKLVVDYKVKEDVNNFEAVVALYDENGLLALKRRTHDFNGKYDLSETFYEGFENAKYVKVFILDSLKNLEPLLVNGYSEIK